MKRNLPIISFCIALLMLCCVGVFAVIHLSVYADADKMVNHTLFVKEKISRVLTQLLDAETGQRGYIITGNELFLQPFYTTIDSVYGIKPTLKELRQLTADNPNYLKRLDLLDLLSGAKIDDMQKAILLRRNSGVDAAIKVVSASKGRQIMDHIRQVIIAVDDEEDLLLQRRMKQASNQLQNVIKVGLSGILTSMVCLVFSFYLTKREEKKRRLADQRLMVSNLELDLRVRELASSNELVMKQLQRLNSLHEVDLAILGSTNLPLTLKAVLAEITTCLHVDSAAVFIFHPDSLMLKIVALTGNTFLDTKRITIRLGDGISGKAALERRTMVAPDLSCMELSPELRSALSSEGIQSIYAAPLIAKGDLVGVLTAGFRSPFNANQDWIDFFEALAAQTAMAVDSVQSFDSLQRSSYNVQLSYEATIEGWSKALDLRDDDTEGHTLRVTDMTMKVALLAGMNEAEMAHIRRGCLLHDIGKMGIPDSILLKPGKLTDEEWIVMRKHPTYSRDLLMPITYLHPALDIPYCHHEKWDGTGYPNGLQGDQIPLAARYFAVVDVWDALRSDRPYRKGWPEEKVLEHIKAASGTHFDPQAVALFLRVLHEDGENAV